jgi:hypothetical protein
MKVTLAELGPNWREKFGACLLMCLLVVSAVGEKENRGFSWLSGVSAFFSCRHPSAFGIHLTHRQLIGHSKVMDALFEVEEKYSHVGASMLKTFFPGKLRPKEKEWWAAYEITAQKHDDEEKTRRKELERVEKAEKETSMQQITEHL